MKYKILSLIIILFLVSTVFASSVNNIFEQKTLYDWYGDVIDKNGHAVTGYDQYDISNVTYTNNEGDVTVKIQLYDVIMDYSFVQVHIFFTSRSNRYLNDYRITTDELDTWGEFGLGENTQKIDVDFEGFGNDSLTYHFSLLDKDETYDFIVVFLHYKEGSDAHVYDQCPNYPISKIIAPEKCQINKIIQFDCVIIDGMPPFKFKWYFSEDGSESEIQNPQYSFSHLGEHLIFLEVEDSNGARDTDYVKITVTLRKSFLGSIFECVPFFEKILNQIIL